jgi:hypothetical protein
MDRAAVQRWLDAYVHAWLTYDPDEIRALFAEHATYCYNPFDDEPVRGREAIVSAWTDPDSLDVPGTYNAHYEPVAVEGNVAVSHGRTRFYEVDGTTLRRQFDNIFVLRFDDAGRCTDFREWYMAPRGQA